MKKIKFTSKCKLRIRHVPRIGKEDIGEFLELTNKTFKRFFDIKISMREVKRASVWLRTLIHELFHFAFHIFDLVFSMRVLPRSEHEFISKVEDTVLIEMKNLRFYKKKGKDVHLDKEVS